MLSIELNPNLVKQKKENNQVFVWDIIRKKWLLKTGEEMVRQSLIHFFITEKKYPNSLIGVEKKIMVGHSIKRFDIVVYNKNFEPWILVECKAPQVDIDHHTFQQIITYNMKVKAYYLLMSNGHSNFCLDCINMDWCDSLPEFQSI